MFIFFFFKQKTAYEMRISDWSSDVCSSDLSWSRVGPAPEGLIGLATSSIDADRLYATTRSGLLVSTDGGRGWRRSQQLASMVHVTPEGTIYAFIAGSGLLKAEEPGFQWTPVSNDFGGALVLHLAAGKGDETQRRLYVVTFDPETCAQAHSERKSTRLNSSHYF